MKTTKLKRIFFIVMGTLILTLTLIFNAHRYFSAHSVDMLLDCLDAGLLLLVFLFYGDLS